MIDRNSIEPLYLQLRKEIAERIRRGDYVKGAFLPTEASLCAEYSVSRVTVRNALASLVDEGYLSRRRGFGTLVVRSRSIEEVSSQNRIAIILNRIADEFTAAILSGFENALRQHQVVTVVGSSDEDSDRELDLIDRFLDIPVDGLAIVACEKSQAVGVLEDLQERGVHVVLVDRDPGSPSSEFVGSDHMSGAASAVEHLKKCGFLRQVFVDYQSAISSASERNAGFLSAAARNGVHVLRPRVLTSDLRRELSELSLHGPIGIVAVNDQVAFRVYRVAHELGLSIGSDIAVVGFDNLVQDQFLVPPLTSVAQNGFLVGKRAADRIVERLAGTETVARREVIPMHLVIRSSCGETP